MAVDSRKEEKNDGRSKYNAVSMKRRKEMKKKQSMFARGPIPKYMSTKPQVSRIDDVLDLHQETNDHICPVETQKDEESSSTSMVVYINDPRNEGCRNVCAR